MRLRAVGAMRPDPDVSEFVVDRGVFVRQLAAIAVLLVTVGVVVQVVRWKAHVPGDHIGIWFFDLDTEGNLPAFFSAALLVLASGLLALTAALERNGKQRPFWGALAVGFVLMAYDEWTARHERLIVPMRELLSEWNLAHPVLYFAWVVPGTALIAVVSIIFAGFLKRLPRDTRVRFLVAGAVYLGGGSRHGDGGQLPLRDFRRQPDAGHDRCGRGSAGNVGRDLLRPLDPESSGKPEP